MERTGDGGKIVFCGRLTAGRGVVHRLRVHRAMEWLAAMKESGALDLIERYGWIACAFLAVIFLVRVFARNPDLEPHRWWLGLYLALLGLTPAVGWLLTRYLHNRYLGVFLSGIYGFLVFKGFLKIFHRAVNDYFGGLVFDMVFSEGSFADVARPDQKLPNLTLLRHWRATGEVKKAYRTARSGLLRRADAFPIWLFAAETAALHLHKMTRAVRLVRKLCDLKEFSDDQKTYAVNQLQFWVASQGYDLDVSHLRDLAAPPPRAKPMTEISQLRQRGEYRQAQSKLQALLKREPANLAAAMLLVRVYAQDLRRLDKAKEMVDDLENSGHVGSGVITFLRNSLKGWAGAADENRAADSGVVSVGEGTSSAAASHIAVAGLPEVRIVPPEPPEPAPPRRKPKSTAPVFTGELPAEIACLLEAGRLGTAVEQLQKNLEQDPEDFASVLHLIQVLVVNCRDSRAGDRVLRNIQSNACFTTEQKALAAVKLAEWKRLPDKSWQNNEEAKQ